MIAPKNLILYKLNIKCTNWHSLKKTSCHLKFHMENKIIQDKALTLVNEHSGCRKFKPSAQSQEPRRYKYNNTERLYLTEEI